MKAVFARFCIILLFVPVLFSCNGNGAGSGSELRDEAMAIHDEIMPLTAEIAEIGMKIKDQLKVMQTDSSGFDTVKVEKAIGILNQLHLADKHMWDWMHGFTGDEEKLEESERKAFYQAELERITALQDEMLAAVETGKEWLKEYAE
jgi:hypothetical protein